MSKIALFVGHSRMIGSRRDGGAVSLGGVSEWDYNRRLAALIRAELREHEVEVVDEYGGDGYGAAMRWVGGRCRELGAELAVELHFNAGGGRGHEWLYWKGSAAGKRAALSLHLAMAHDWPDRYARGCKGLGVRDRGGMFLQATPCPAVVCEPFFGDDRGDWNLFGMHEARLAKTMAMGLAAAAASIRNI